MRFPSTLVPAAILRRLHRFAVLAQVDGAEVMAHLANSGRLTALLQPGTPGVLLPCRRPGRLTSFDLCLVRQGKVWVSVDARLPNCLVAEALSQGRLAPLSGYTVLRPEVHYQESRIDFLLHGAKGPCLVEVKSVTLVEAGIARFPDAPTERGRRHLQTLMEAARAGYHVAVLFVIQRSDARAFGPNDAVDPDFAGLLRQAAASGVQILAYRCQVSLAEIVLADPATVIL